MCVGQAHSEIDTSSPDILATRVGVEEESSLGGGVGFWNCMSIYPDTRIGVVMMGNATTHDHEAIARAVAARWRT